MDKCAACNEAVKPQDGITCVKCHVTRHVKLKCAGISKASVVKDKKLRKTFICDSCQASSESESDSTETRSASGRTPNRGTLDIVLKKLDDMETKWEKRMNQFQAAVDMCSAQVDDITKLKVEVSQLAKRIKTLEKAPNQSTETQKEVIISNVPPLQKEETVKIARAIFSSLEAGIEESEVRQASRFQTGTGETTRHFIKVKLSNHESKGKVIKAARAAKANLKDLQLCVKTGLTFENSDTLGKDFLLTPVFINEAVSKETRLLLRAAIALKKEKKIHTTWTYQDRVYIRKEPQARPVAINSESNLREFQ